MWPTGWVSGRNMKECGRGKERKVRFFYFFFLSFCAFPFPSRFDSFHLSTISKARWRPNAPTLPIRKTRECPVRDCQSYLVVYAIFVFCSTPICLRKKNWLSLSRKGSWHLRCWNNAQNDSVSHTRHILSAAWSRSHHWRSRGWRWSVFLFHTISVPLKGLSVMVIFALNEDC